MKSILLIGLGKFGQYMARRFSEQGNEVLAIDQKEERVNEVLRYVTNAQICDPTNEDVIASLGVRNFDLCIVAVGDNFQVSLETTSLLKEHGAKFVLARAMEEVHAKFLLRNGADEIIFAERETAERVVSKYGSDNVFDYIQLTPEYSIYEIPVPAAWVGKSILQKDVRNKFHVSILATKQGNELNPLPKPEHIFASNETLMIMGHNEDVRKLVK